MLPRTWIFAGLFGSCALVSAAQAQQPVRLASPVEGERLEAGERAWVEWTPTEAGPRLGLSTEDREAAQRLG